MAYSYGAPLTPAETRYRQLAEALMSRGVNPGITMGGIGGIGQGIGALAQTFAGRRLAERADKERQGSIDKAMAQIQGLNLPPETMTVLQGLTGIEPMAGLTAAAGMVGKQQEDDFTLSPGQTRFRGGQPVASLPAEAEKPEWVDAKGPGNVTFQYRPDTGETTLAKPTGGFYTLEELGGGAQPSIETEALPAAPQAAPAAYEPTIQKAAAEFGVPPDLLRGVLSRESGFDPNAISPAGATGIAQFMPETASEMGIDPTDPQESIYAAAQYLKQNYDKFGKSWTNALAAYNWGPGNLEKQGILKAPKETRDYIAALSPLVGEKGETKVAAGEGFDWQQYITPKEAATTDPIKLSSDLRKEFNDLPEVKNYKTVIPVIDAAYETLGNNNKASDLNLVYALAKIMDPGSVVREGEMIMVTDSASPANKALGYLNYLSGGASFTPELRQQLMTELQGRVNALQQQYDLAYQQYADLASQYEVDPTRVVGQARAQKKRAVSNGAADPDRAKAILRRWGIE